MNEEIMKILKMVESGKIDAEKASKLIEALNNYEDVEYVNKKEDFSSKKNKLKILVKSQDGDNVNINLPLKVIKGILKISGKIPGVDLKGNDIDPKIIIDAIDSGVEGKIVDINSEDGDKVEISIE